MILGPTFSEMRDPTLLPEELRAQVRAADPLDPVRLFDVRWMEDNGEVQGWLVPPELTGIDAPIAVLLGSRFPTGSHKVGAAYSCVVERQLTGTLDTNEHTLVFPSTGNYGIGGAWVGPRMGYRSLVVLPEEMSAERFEMIKGYGADIVATPGSESNVKEIYDEVKRLRKRPEIRVLNQFEEWGNYRFHHGVTSHAAEQLSKQLGYGGRVAAFVSAMGSSGTIGAGDRLKTTQDTRIVGLEPIQCPTLYNVGYGAHRIEGIGDKHVTWIHNVLNMDLLCCIDDEACVRGLQMLQEGAEVLTQELGLDTEAASGWLGRLGVSGLCNLLGAMKSAKHFGLGKDDLVVTLATDGFDRYPSVLRLLEQREGPQSREVTLRRLQEFQAIDDDWLLEGNDTARLRWHNQKYFTWVEQQGKNVAELDALKSQAFWEDQAGRIEEVDAAILAARSA
ncbi:MAG: pyridoxal-phosphate dependent enzyme [Myxococcota bacterium]|nr:pyridoxal-phosphate dependent enzyme [Myxococcota bacterium]